MFYSPSELMSIPSVDLGSPSGEDFSAGWERKRYQAEGRGLADSVEAEGIKTPVVISEGEPSGVPTLGNGHHRVASAAGTGQLVPAIHDTDFMGYGLDDSYPSVRNADRNYL